jgi:predicted transcriptional regulator
MIVTNKPLFALTANDLMSQSLVLVPQEMSLQGAAHLLTQSQVSGAPVIDAEGRCIGVLSSMDFVHMVEQNSHPRRPCESPSEEVFTSSQIVKSEDEKYLVRDHMTADPVLVSPNTNIGELAQMMMNAHIHRVIVATEEGKPVGIVSTMDILAALAHAYKVQEREPNFASTAETKEIVDKVSYSLE